MESLTLEISQTHQDMFLYHLFQVILQSVGLDDFQRAFPTSAILGLRKKTGGKQGDP